MRGTNNTENDNFKMANWNIAYPINNISRFELHWILFYKNALCTGSRVY